MLGAISHEFPEFSHVATRGAVLPLLLSPPTASHSLCSAGSAPHNDAAATGDFLISAAEHLSLSIQKHLSVVTTNSKLVSATQQRRSHSGDFLIETWRSRCR